MPTTTPDKKSTLALPYGKEATRGVVRYYEKQGDRTAYIVDFGKKGQDGIDRARYGGFDLAEFDASGNRQWKFHSGEGATDFPDAFFSHLNWNGAGRSFAEVKLPAQYSDEEEPTRSEFWTRAMKTKDYDAGGNALNGGATAFRRGNAHVVADLVIEQAAAFWARLGVDPRALIEWGSWVEFKQECDHLLTWATGNGLRGEYFDNIDLTDLKKTRTDSQVNFDWSDSYPANEIAADTFSARWLGKVKPEFTQTYTFYTYADDGVRLWVNNVQLVNEWSDGAARERSGTINLTAGVEYDIKLEYYQQTGPAVVQLSWSSASRPKQIIPQERLFAGERQVPRYTADVVFTTRTPLEDAIRQVLMRAPGVTMQQVNGLWRFLPKPDRAKVHRLSFDTTQTAVRPNIVDGSFELLRRDPEEKPREIVVNYLDEDDLYFKARQVKIVRDDYVGEPLEFNIGVATQSLAERIGESLMRRFDLDLFYRATAFPDSYKLAKGDVSEVSNSVFNLFESAPEEFRVVEEKLLPTGDLHELLLQLHRDDFYSDTAHGQLTWTVGADSRSALAAPPVVSNVAAAESDYVVQDGTHLAAISGRAYFAEHGHPQRGRVWWRNPAEEKAITADAGTDVLTAGAHGLVNGTPVSLRNVGGALPAPLSGSATYFVRDATTNTFKLAAAAGGAALDVTGAGSGNTYVAAFKLTDRGGTPDRTSRQLPFELLGVAVGTHQLKVVPESEAGVYRPFEQHAIYAVQVVGISTLLPAVTGFKAVATRGGRGHIFTLSWNPVSDPNNVLLYYRIYSDAALTQLVYEGADTSTTVKAFSFQPEDFWIVAVNKARLAGPSATTRAATVFADVAGGGTLSITAAGSFSWTSNLTVSPVPADVAPSGAIAIAPASYALGLGQILVARHTHGQSTPVLSVFNLSSYAQPTSGTQTDFEIARREADGALTLFDGRKLQPGTRLLSTGAINQYGRFVGRDADYVDVTKASFYDYAQVKTDRDNDWLEYLVYCNFDTVLGNTDASANADSLSEAQVEAFDKFGDRVAFMYYTYRGLGEVGRLSHTRTYCDVDTELAIRLTFRNAFGWGDAALWLCLWNPAGVRTYAPPAWKVAVNCPRELLATPRSSSEVVLTFEWSGSARSVWRREVRGLGIGYGAQWVDITSQVTGDRITTATVTGLSPYTRYEFRINDGTVGAGGNSSNIAYVRTFPPALAASSRPAPSNAQGSPQSATSVRFVWSRNASDNADVEYAADTGSGFGAWTAFGDATKQEHTLSVTAGSTTRFKVRNKWSTGTTYSDESNVAEVATSAANPSSTDPTNLRVTGTSPPSVSFQWDVNSGTNPTLRVKQLSGVGAGTQTNINPTATTTTHSLSLAADTQYEAWVTTANGGRDSNHIFFTTVRNVEDDQYR